MSNLDDRLDQPVLARLWELENAGAADQRAALAGDEYLSLFLDTDDGRSYVFRHGTEAASPSVEAGSESEVFEFPTAHNARAAYDEMLGEAAREGRLADTDAQPALGDPETEGPVTSEVGEENLRDR